MFGQSFVQSGLWSGTVRVLQRCARIYAVHLGLFAALALSCVAGNALFTGHDYIRQLNLTYFFDQTHTALPAMAALHYLPNGIDILPMYLVLLAWTPVFWALSRAGRPLAGLISVALYLATYFTHLNLSAEPGSQRGWFFNPFAWQLLFFAGYALGEGWINIRLGSRTWLRAGLAIVLLAVPFAHEADLRPLTWMQSLYGLIDPWYEKTRLGPLRLLHFTAMAYLTATLLARHGAWLQRPLAIMVRVLGQHSLPVFSFGLLLAWILGMVLDQTGHGLTPLLIVNLGGLALLTGFGQMLEWLDGKPWKQLRIRQQTQRLPRSPREFNLADFRRLVLQPLAMGAMLTPLAVAPFLLPKQRLPDPIQSETLAEIETDGAAAVEEFDDRVMNGFTDPEPGALLTVDLNPPQAAGR